VELRRAWVTACVAAEAVGMTAAALAWTAADRLDEPAAALSVVVVGGLVEGFALGGLQGRVLARRFGRLLARRWAVTTTVVAGVGWAAGSAPSVLATSEGPAESPPVGLVLLGAAALGALMGLALGAAQSLVLRARAVRPWRWSAVSALAWAPTMVVVFVGAGVPSSDWPTLAVVVTATLTGATAGTVLGVLTRPWLPAPVVPALRSPLGVSPRGPVR
jgi:hypothetical protein